LACGLISSNFYRPLRSSEIEPLQTCLPFAIPGQPEDIEGKVVLVFERENSVCHFVQLDEEVISADSQRVRGRKLVDRIFFQMFDRNLFWVFFSLKDEQLGAIGYML